MIQKSGTKTAPPNSRIKIPVLTACPSQISCADGKVCTTFDYFTGTLCFSGDGEIDDSWKECYDSSSVRRVVIKDGIKKLVSMPFIIAKVCRAYTFLILFM